jgi:hypothetical protein
MTISALRRSISLMEAEADGSACERRVREETRQNQSVEKTFLMVAR